MKLFDVVYERRRFRSERAHIWDGKRFIALNKKQTERQREYERLHAATEALLGRLKQQSPAAP